LPEPLEHRPKCETAGARLQGALPRRDTVTDPTNMKPVSEIRMDRNNLYREEVVTDLRVGSIQILTPVTMDGTRDPSRDPLYTGEAQIMGPTGPLPIRTRIDASSLEEAIEKFPQAVDAAVRDVAAQLRELQRQEMSRIVTPDEVAPTLGGLGGAGIPGAGGPSKIVLK